MPLVRGPAAAATRSGSSPRRLFIDVDKPGDGALVEQAIRGGNKAEGRGNDLVAIGNPQGADRHVQPSRATAACHPKLAVDQRGNLLLEGLGEAAKGEHIARQHLGDEFPLAVPDPWLGHRDAAWKRGGVVVGRELAT